LMEKEIVMVLPVWAISESGRDVSARNICTVAVVIVAAVVMASNEKEEVEVSMMF